MWYIVTWAVLTRQSTFVEQVPSFPNSNIIKVTGFTTKVFWCHVLERQALCSFVACLPTVLGISCYSCHEYLGSNQTCSNPSISSCASYYDSCMTLRVTAQFMGLNISQTLKNCSISSTCGSTVVCDQVNSTISGTGITMLSCTLDCCSGDLCNGQGTSCYVCVSGREKSMKSMVDENRW